ncbi:MAG: YigZ family protein [Clostridia bacterium]|nr:YigZ family protein [Clostridia bacterium]
MAYYQSVVGTYSCERIVEKSRFLTYVSHTEGEDAARAFLSEVRASHPLATHVCFAYISDKIGNEQRFSDDGEPQGTAGMPILNVLKAQKLFETTVAVVRYFGGIKLGAGGLTRAYSSAAAEGLDGAQKRGYETCVEAKIRVDYAQIDAILRFFAGESAQVLSQEYGEKAEYTVAVKEVEFDLFSGNLVNYLNGKVSIEEGEKYFYPFPVERK